jgi:hypothetical protein
MYQKPRVTRYGTIRELTKAGCVGGSDGLLIAGIGTAVGEVPFFRNDNTTVVCFVGAS